MKQTINISTASPFPSPSVSSSALLSLFVRLGRADRRQLLAKRGGFGLHVAHLGLGLGDLPQHALVRGAQRGQLPPLVVGETLLGPCARGCAVGRVQVGGKEGVRVE